MPKSLLKVDNLYDPRHMLIGPSYQTSPQGPIPCSNEMWTISSKEGEVIIVDGIHRPAHARDGVTARGLHQALEAKEGVRVESEKPDLGHRHLSELFPHV